MQYYYISCGFILTKDIAIVFTVYVGCGLEGGGGLITQLGWPQYIFECCFYVFYHND